LRVREGGDWEDGEEERKYIGGSGQETVWIRDRWEVHVGRTAGEKGLATGRREDTP